MHSRASGSFIKVFGTVTRNYQMESALQYQYVCAVEDKYSKQNILAYNLKFHQNSQTLSFSQYYSMQPDRQEEEEIEEKDFIQSKKKWKELDLHQQIIDVLKSINKQKPTKVQEHSLEITNNPDRKKYSLLIQSGNGTGKTYSFLLPILNSLKQGIQVTKDRKMGEKTFKNEIFCPQAMIVVGTQLLSQQIYDELNKFLDYFKKQDKKAEHLNFTIGRLEKEHSAGDILICMPKSVLSRYDRKNLQLHNCSFVAFDEVDELYDQEQTELKRIIEIVDKQENTKLIACSATMKPEFITWFKETIKSNLLEINMRKESKDTITLEGVSNYRLTLEGEQEKYNFMIDDLFRELYDHTEKIKPKAFIFFNKIEQIEDFLATINQIKEDESHHANRYLKFLKLGVAAGNRIVNGQKKATTNEEKRAVMNQFRQNEIRVLLATNSVARGIDVRDVCLVINMDAPRTKGQIDIDTYLHRVGRTGRHQDQGVALTLIDSKDEQRLVDGIKKVHKVDIKKMESVEVLVKEVENCINTNKKYVESLKQGE